MTTRDQTDEPIPFRHMHRAAEKPGIDICPVLSSSDLCLALRSYLTCPHRLFPAAWVLRNMDPGLMPELFEDLDPIWRPSILHNLYHPPTKRYREGVLGLTSQLAPRSQQPSSVEF